MSFIFTKNPRKLAKTLLSFTDGINHAKVVINLSGKYVFNAIHKNIILAKISEFTVSSKTSDFNL